MQTLHLESTKSEGSQKATLKRMTWSAILGAAFPQQMLQLVGES